MLGRVTVVAVVVIGAATAALIQGKVLVIRPFVGEPPLNALTAFLCISCLGALLAVGICAVAVQTRRGNRAATVKLGRPGRTNP